MFLTADELQELTGYKQKPKQIEALGDMAISFRLRAADGFPLVDRESLTAGRPVAKAKRPNFAALED